MLQFDTYDTCFLGRIDTLLKAGYIWPLMCSFTWIVHILEFEWNKNPEYSVIDTFQALNTCDREP